MKKLFLYSDDMIEEEEEEEEEEKMEGSNQPETKNLKTEKDDEEGKGSKLVHEIFTWTEWDQKLEGDRVKGKSEFEKFLLCMVMSIYFLSVC